MMSVINQPLVSIVLCTYNGEKYIKEQLNSLIDQTYSNLELIICDDCSIDHTISIINETLKDSNIIYKLSKNDVSLGYYRNFEKGIGLANGEFIALCDQDDIWLRNKIEVLVNEIKDNSLIYSNSDLIDDEGISKGNSLGNIMNMVDGGNVKKLLLHNSVSAHSLLFSRKLISNLLPFPDLKFHDWWIAINAMCNGGIKYLEKSLVKYRIHANNATDIKSHVEKKEIHKKAKSDNWKGFLKLKQETDFLKILLQRVQLNPDQFEFIDNYRKLLLKREFQILSIQFGVLWLKDHKSLLFCGKMKSFKRFRFLTRKFFGFGLKRFLYQLNNKI